MNLALLEKPPFPVAGHDVSLLGLAAFAIFPAPSVFLTQFGDNALDFELVVWSSEMSHRPSRFKSDLNFAIEEKLREAGIRIPFPQRDLHIRSEALPVRE